MKRPNWLLLLLIWCQMTTDDKSLDLQRYAWQGRSGSGSQLRQNAKAAQTGPAQPYYRTYTQPGSTYMLAHASPSLWNYELNSLHKDTKVFVSLRLVLRLRQMLQKSEDDTQNILLQYVSHLISAWQGPKNSRRKDSQTSSSEGLVKHLRGGDTGNIRVSQTSEQRSKQSSTYLPLYIRSHKSSAIVHAVVKFQSVENREQWTHRNKECRVFSQARQTKSQKRASDMSEREENGGLPQEALWWRVKVIIQMDMLSLGTKTFILSQWRELKNSCSHRWRLAVWQASCTTALSQAQAHTLLWLRALDSVFAVIRPELGLSRSDDAFRSSEDDC